MSALRLLAAGKSARIFGIAMIVLIDLRLAMRFYTYGLRMKQQCGILKGITTSEIGEQVKVLRL